MLWQQLECQSKSESGSERTTEGRVESSWLWEGKDLDSHSSFKARAVTLGEVFNISEPQLPRLQMRIMPPAL